MKSLALIAAICFCASSAFAQDRFASVADSDARIPLIRNGKTLYLHAEKTARAFGWKAALVKLPKEEGQTGLLTICREEEGGICIPLRLGKVKFLKRGEDLFVESAALAEALRLRVRMRGGNVTLQPSGERREPESEIPAYHADWGKDRGFRPGQTLPDIPLYDLDGNEVRFSTFLGKQYILYCWASW